MARDDVRARRAERVKQDRGKNFVQANGKYILAGVAVVALVGVAVTLYEPPVPQKFAHEHASFSMFVEGEEIGFTDPAYDLQNTGAGESHLHFNEQHGGKVIHIEARFPNGIPDIDLDHFFLVHGITFDPGFVRLDDKAGHGNREVRDEGNQTWRLYVSRLVGEGEYGPWERQTGDYTAFVPRDGDRMLITYGSDDFLTPEELAAQQATVPEPPGAAPPRMPEL